MTEAMSQDAFEEIMDEWLIRQFPHLRDIDLIMIRDGMLNVYEGDAAFWQRMPLRSLYEEGGRVVARSAQRVEG
jgi:hypothetical protein